MLPDTAEHEKTALHLQTLGQLHSIRVVAAPSPSAPQHTRSRFGGGGAPRREIEAPPITDIVEIDHDRVAARVFARRKIDRIAAEIGLLARKKK